MASQEPQPIRPMYNDNLSVSTDGALITVSWNKEADDRSYEIQYVERGKDKVFMFTRKSQVL